MEYTWADTARNESSDDDYYPCSCNGYKYHLGAAINVQHEMGTEGCAYADDDDSLMEQESRRMADLDDGIIWGDDF